MTQPTLSGIYPRDETHIRTTWNYDKKLATADQLRQAQHTAAQELATLQASAHMADTMDGLFRWQDLLRPIASATEGIEVGGLVRFHETNTFLRRPILKESFDAGAFNVKAFLDHTFTDVWASGPKGKAVLPSPYFVLRTSVDETFGSAEAAAGPIADVIGAAAKAAAGAGAGVVQFNDPTLLHETEPDIQLARAMVERATSGLSIETTYYPYAGDAAPHWDALASFPTKRIGVDFTQTDIDDLGGLPNGKALLAGVVDGRSSLVEPKNALAGFLGRLANAFDGADVQATHAYDLDFVPSEVAAKKIQALGEACRVTAEVAQ